MNKVLRGFLLCIPGILCSLCGTTFMITAVVFKKTFGVLNIEQMVVIGIMSYVLALSYMILLGAYYARNRFSEEGHIELIEQE